jgi:DNA-binding response OmpR family regulator
VVLSRAVDAGRLGRRAGVVGAAEHPPHLAAEVLADPFGDDHLVDVHVANLRRKLGDDPRRPRYVRTVRGVGYRMGPGT